MYVFRQTVNFQHKLAMFLYRLQQDERLGQQVAEEVVMGQSDALKVSGGVDELQQLRELRLQHVHLETETRR